MSGSGMSAIRLVMLALVVMIAIAGCSWFVQRPPAPAPARPPSLPPVPTYDLVASIRAAGAREKSVITVNGVMDPGVVALKDAAAREASNGQYDQAVASLDKALKLSPDSPDLLQDRAEIAIRQKDFPKAEALARQSWALGAKLGSLCARNWQTIVEIRLQARDLVGATAARKSVQACHKPGVTRY